MNAKLKQEMLELMKQLDSNNIEKNVIKKLSANDKKELEKNCMLANAALKKTGKSMGDMIDFMDDDNCMDIYNEKLEKAYIESLKTTTYLRDSLRIILPKEEYDSLPIHPKGENIDISFENDILRVCIPQICPRRILKRNDLNMMKESLNVAMKRFQPEFLEKRNNQLFEHYILLEKYILPEINPVTRDLDRFYSSHIVDVITNYVAKEDSSYYMREYTRMCKYKGREPYTIIYLAEPIVFNKFSDKLKR